ncbi:Uma2 family endonuclease [Streptomyces eurocidicus]|uniref:Uma2 family endonuclease n=2 Tax=Streptomyces eurocidicus TaxID=66423 RepID=A0A7W8BD14_STREU|nr:Uma2 family endonuclease [Streptomyces eurocidicus]MBB5120578.1 Uma2 family endonuclease [Streptomyces eurocidicus]
MTIAPIGGTGMAGKGDQDFDDMFELLYGITPEGYKSEIVGGAILMSPPRHTHWAVIRDVLLQLEARFGEDSLVECDVRLDLPGYRNGFVPDLFKPADGAEMDAKGKWRYQDVEFVFEVISRETADNDYGRKKAAYAAGDVPVYVIADPYTGQCHVHTVPKDGEYRANRTLDFGDPVDLSDTPLGLVLATGKFPRD